MISVEKAIQLVRANVVPLESINNIKMENALGHVLSEDVCSPIDMPPFRQSAMDGYALCLNGGTSYQVIDEVKAGDNHNPKLNKGEAIRIFTGAAVPDTANAVVIQERVSLDGNIIHIDHDVPLNENIRPRGEQIKKGGVALNKNSFLSPAAIGYLTTLGITEVQVFKKPRITILVTGNELIVAGNPLKYGQIYESNALMLASALESLGYAHSEIRSIPDNYQDTLNSIRTAFVNNDLILISGGISVGDYDFVGKALHELSVEKLFYKVKQKPGKPLFFGKKGNTYVFALPGNPASALSCFYFYVQTALHRLSGRSGTALNRIQAISRTEFLKKGDRAQFLKALYNAGEVTILDGQSSSMLNTFALANALVYIPENKIKIELNEKVEIILLPNN